MTGDFPPAQRNKLSGSYPELFNTVEKYSRYPLEEYSPLLWNYSGQHSLETELVQSIQSHYAERFQPETGERLCRQLEKYPVIQTTHHIAPTLGPVFNTVDLIALNGLPDGLIYPVGACTGVAYSNAAHSGAISFSKDHWHNILLPGDRLDKALKSQRERTSHGDNENRISLIPSKMRDALVYQSGITQNTTGIYDELQPETRFHFAKPELGAPYSLWGLDTMNNIQRKIHSFNDYEAFDLNDVISKYTVNVLEKGNLRHPLHQILFDKKIQQEIIRIFGNVELFLTEKPGKKTSKIQRVCIEDLLGHQKGDEFYNRLKNNTLCPAVFITFFVLNGLNGLKCLGSFYQTDYLKKFRIGWNKVFPELVPEKEKMTPSLTMGKAVQSDGSLLYSVDLLCQNKIPEKERYRIMKMGKLWEPIIQKLLLN